MCQCVINANKILNTQQMVMQIKSKRFCVVVFLHKANLNTASMYTDWIQTSKDTLRTWKVCVEGLPWRRSRTALLPRSPAPCRILPAPRTTSCPQQRVRPPSPATCRQSVGWLLVVAVEQAWLPGWVGGWMDHAQKRRPSHTQQLTLKRAGNQDFTHGLRHRQVRDILHCGGFLQASCSQYFFVPLWVFLPE